VSVSLTKGGNVSLSKAAPGLSAVVVGLGWDPRTTTGTDFDLDASALVVDAGGKVLSDQHFVFFNNLKSPDGAVEHTGDNLTGEGEGDDEQIKVNLGAVPAEGDKIVFAVSIYAPRGTHERSATASIPRSRLVSPAASTDTGVPCSRTSRSRR
jgi:tellurium resistance protein TerD